MLRRTFSALTLAAIISIAASCVIHKDAGKIFGEYIDTGNSVSSASFTVKEAVISGSSPFVQNVKIIAKRSKNNSEEYVYEAFADSIYSSAFDGKNYTFLNRSDSTALVSDSAVYSKMLAQKYRSLIELVIMSSKNMLKQIEKAKVFRYDGNVNVNGVDCNVIYLENIGFDENSRVKTYFYIGEKDHFIRKLVRRLTSGNLTVQEDKYYIEGLQTDIDLSGLDFALDIPRNFKIEKYEPPKPKTEENVQLLGVGEDAPDFKLNFFDNKVFTLSESLGKVVVLDFWGTWCPWCVVALPKIQTIKDKLPEVDVLGISCKESEGSDPTKFLKDKGIKYPTLLKGDEVAALYKVTGFPTLYVIGRNGKIIYAEAGYYAEMADVIIKLIEEHLKEDI